MRPLWRQLVAVSSSLHPHALYVPCKSEEPREAWRISERLKAFWGVWVTWCPMCAMQPWNYIPWPATQQHQLWTGLVTKQAVLCLDRLWFWTPGAWARLSIPHVQITTSHLFISSPLCLLLFHHFSLYPVKADLQIWLNIWAEDLSNNWTQAY